MVEQNRVNEEKDRNTQREETEVITKREKVDKEAIRKMGTQGEIATKSEKDTQKRERQRKMTKERHIKTKNTFSVLQEEDTKSLQEEEKPPQIVKVDKDEKKIFERKRRGRKRKSQSKKKGPSEMGPKPGLPKNYSNKRIQNKNRGSLRCKSTKYYNMRNTYKTKKCVELHNKLHHSQQGKEKLQELKEKKLQSCIQEKRAQMLKPTRRRYLCESVCINEKIYNNIFSFKEDAPIKKTTDLFEKRIICEEKQCNRYELLMEECLEIHNLVFHGNQHFEVEHRPIEHSCKNKNEKLKCRTLIETNIQGNPNTETKRVTNTHIQKASKIERQYQNLKIKRT